MDVRGKTFLCAIGLVSLSLTRGDHKRWSLTRSEGAPVLVAFLRRRQQAWEITLPNMNSLDAADEATLDPTRWVLSRYLCWESCIALVSGRWEDWVQEFLCFTHPGLRYFPYLYPADHWLRKDGLGARRQSSAEHSLPRVEGRKAASLPQCWLSESLRMWRRRLCFRAGSQIQWLPDLPCDGQPCFPQSWWAGGLGQSQAA